MFILALTHNTAFPVFSTWFSTRIFWGRMSKPLWFSGIIPRSLLSCFPSSSLACLQGSCAARGERQRSRPRRRLPRHGQSPGPSGTCGNRFRSHTRLSGAGVTRGLFPAAARDRLPPVRQTRSPRGRDRLPPPLTAQPRSPAGKGPAPPQRSPQEGAARAASALAPPRPRPPPAKVSPARRARAPRGL